VVKSSKLVIFASFDDLWKLGDFRLIGLKNIPDIYSPKNLTNWEEMVYCNEIHLYFSCNLEKWPQH
jgi:hypothetical protein